MFRRVLNCSFAVIVYLLTFSSETNGQVSLSPRDEVYASLLDHRLKLWQERGQMKPIRHGELPMIRTISDDVARIGDRFVIQPSSELHVGEIGTSAGEKMYRRIRTREVDWIVADEIGFAWTFGGAGGRSTGRGTFSRFNMDGVYWPASIEGFATFVPDRPDRRYIATEADLAGARERFTTDLAVADWLAAVDAEGYAHAVDRLHAGDPEARILLRALEWMRVRFYWQYRYQTPSFVAFAGMMTNRTGRLDRDADGKIIFVPLNKLETSIDLYATDGEYVGQLLIEHLTPPSPTNPAEAEPAEIEWHWDLIAHLLASLKLEPERPKPEAAPIDPSALRPRHRESGPGYVPPPLRAIRTTIDQWREQGKMAEPVKRIELPAIAFEPKDPTPLHHNLSIKPSQTLSITEIGSMPSDRRHPKPRIRKDSKFDMHDEVGFAWTFQGVNGRGIVTRDDIAILQAPGINFVARILDEPSPDRPHVPTQKGILEAKARFGNDLGVADWIASLDADDYIAHYAAIVRGDKTSLPVFRAMEELQIRWDWIMRLRSDSLVGFVRTDVRQWSIRVDPSSDQGPYDNFFRVFTHITLYSTNGYCVGTVRLDRVADEYPDTRIDEELSKYFFASLTYPSKGVSIEQPAKPRDSEP